MMKEPAKAGRGSIQGILRQLALFNQVDRKQIEQIEHQASLITLAKGARLFEKGDPVTGFFVILSGQIKLALPVNPGSERIIDTIGPGQSFGEALMFLDRPYPLFAQAVMPTTLVKVAQQPVLELLATDTLFARRMLAGMSMRLHQLILDIDLSSKLTGVQRVVSFLLQQLSITGGGNSGADGTTVRLP